MKKKNRIEQETRSFWILPWYSEFDVHFQLAATLADWTIDLIGKGSLFYFLFENKENNELKFQREKKKEE